MCVLGPVSESAGNQHQEEIEAPPFSCGQTSHWLPHPYFMCGLVQLYRRGICWRVSPNYDRLGRLPGFATFGTFTGFTTGYQVHSEYTVYTVWHVYDCLPGLHRLARLRLVTGFTTGYQVYTDYTVYNVYSVYSVYSVYADWNVYNVYNIYDWLRQRLLNCPIWQSCLGYTWGVFYIFKLSTRHWDFCYE